MVLGVELEFQNFWNISVGICGPRSVDDASHSYVATNICGCADGGLLAWSDKFRAVK
jgi:hypothetical protein